MQQDISPTVIPANASDNILIIVSMSVSLLRVEIHLLFQNPNTISMGFIMEVWGALYTNLCPACSIISLRSPPWIEALSMTNIRLTFLEAWSAMNVCMTALNTSLVTEPFTIWIYSAPY